MKRLRKTITSGVRLSDDGQYYEISNINLANDIIDLVDPQLYKSIRGTDVYWFGYRFNDDVNSKDRTKFIHYVKGLSSSSIPDDDLMRLVERPLAALNKAVNLYDIDCFVYPVSGRSQLVSKMVQVINRFTSREMPRLSFELVKSAPVDIQFDWDLFESDLGDNPTRYAQMSEYVNDTLLPMIHGLDYFSLANSVKPKYRKYITNFLSFSDEDIKKLSALHGSNILIVDDISTSGSTLDEILRIVSKINQQCRIYVYTLIGK